MEEGRDRNYAFSITYLGLSPLSIEIVLNGLLEGLLELHSDMGAQRDEIIVVLEDLTSGVFRGEEDRWPLSTWRHAHGALGKGTLLARRGS